MLLWCQQHTVISAQFQLTSRLAGASLQIRWPFRRVMLRKFHFSSLFLALWTDACHLKLQMLFVVVVGECNPVCSLRTTLVFANFGVFKVRRFNRESTVARQKMQRRLLGSQRVWSSCDVLVWTLKASSRKHRSDASCRPPACRHLC